MMIFYKIPPDPILIIQAPIVNTDRGEGAQHLRERVRASSAPSAKSKLGLGIRRPLGFRDPGSCRRTLTIWSQSGCIGPSNDYGPDSIVCATSS